MVVRPAVWNRHHGIPPAPTGAIVYVGRGTPWGNPFRIGRDGTRGQVVASYRAHLERRADLLDLLEPLMGAEYLVCSCAPRPCHADVLADKVAALREFRESRALFAAEYPEGAALTEADAEQALREVRRERA